MQGLAADGDRQQIAAPDGNGLPPGNARDVEKKDGVESAVSRISDFVQNFQRDLQFSVDRLSGRTVIKVVDSETNQVIRQIPSEESLRIARHLDSPDSLILSERA
ncbi:MAG TPA: flagellar protein FlaG [Gammaproteobacteria bacterium]|nr:flagellar protein FlaG [Gammaproteobacteria bacterium]